MLTEHGAGHERGQPGHVAEGRGVQRVDPGQLGDAPGAGQGSDVVHPPQDQLAVDGVGVVEGPGGRVTEPLPAAGGDTPRYTRSRRGPRRHRRAPPSLPGGSLWGREGGRRGRGQQRVVVRGGQQQRQHRVARLLVQVEAVAAVAALVGHGHHVGEGGALGEGHRPLRGRGRRETERRRRSAGASPGSGTRPRAWRPSSPRGRRPAEGSGRRPATGRRVGAPCLARRLWRSPPRSGCRRTSGCSCSGSWRRL